MTYLSPNILTIASAGFLDRQYVETTPPTMSWRTDGPGTLETTMQTRDLAKLGIRVLGRTDQLKGKWAFYQHPTAGGWGGVVTSTDVAGPYTQIICEQFAVLMRARQVSSVWKALGASPGALALQYVQTAERHGDTFGLTSFAAYEGGEPVDYEPRGGDLCDEILPELASFGYQWHVRSDTIEERAFRFYPRIGTDKRREITLVDGVHIAMGSLAVSGDLWTVANSIEGINADLPYESATGYTLEDNTSIRELGRRYERSIPYSGVATRTTIAPLVKRDLLRYRYPTEVATCDIVDDGLIWAQLREGDTIMVESGECNVRCPMTVDIRALDVGRGLLQIGGELLIAEAV
jgi:hypothetical protein